ncbi:MAG: hypothetical protein ACI9OJ_001878 [Myxococcota bacterium]|jgi:hypothetical protein
MGSLRRWLQPVRRSASNSTSTDDTSPAIDSAGSISVRLTAAPLDKQVGGAQRAFVVNYLFNPVSAKTPVIALSVDPQAASDTEVGGVPTYSFKLLVFVLDDRANCAFCGCTGRARTSFSLPRGTSGVGSLRRVWSASRWVASAWVSRRSQWVSGHAETLIRVEL